MRAASTPNISKAIDVVVHLAGESIGSGRWTREKKRAILESRVKGTSLLSESLARLSRPPSVFLSASAIGYYGDRGDELLTEKSAPGNDFLAGGLYRMGRQRRARSREGNSERFTHASGSFSTDEGGALAKMLTPFRMGIGGKVGDGKQWMSWIALEDVVNGLKFLIGETSTRGPVNFVAPNPVTNAEFTKTLGRVLSRPTIFPVPAFGVRLAFGEMADALLLSSQKSRAECFEEQGV